jgi:MFS family permease
MNLSPQLTITESELAAGKKKVILDGLATESMSALCTGAFLVALALLMGANNFQIGMLASLPTFTNIFQLVSIWLVRRFNNRRAISVYCSILARVPLIVIGCIALFSKSSANINMLIFFLSFFYLFGSIAGPSWNSWMKDFIPENSLGTFFSKRTRYTQIISAVFSICAAFFVDYIKQYHPEYELRTYSYMFIIAGIFGLTGVFFLSRTPEPVSQISKDNIFKLLQRPLHNTNFRNLLIFNSFWVFALNIAIPFFTVYMMTTLGLPISYVIAFAILSQICSISTVGLWGNFSDKYSNKTIIAICGPLYILCITAWSFVGIYTHQYANFVLIGCINIFSGISTAGINLSLTNIGLKLAPKDSAIVYLAAKNIITSLFSSMAPLIGGYLADFFANRHLNINAVYTGPRVTKDFHLLLLHQWNFLFIIGAVLAFIALQLLTRVKEKGEVEKDVVVRILRSSIKNNIKDYFIIGRLLDVHEHVRSRIEEVFRPKKKDNIDE